MESAPDAGEDEPTHKTMAQPSHSAPQNALCCAATCSAYTFSYSQEHLHTVQAVQFNSSQFFSLFLDSPALAVRWRTTCVFELNLQVPSIDRADRNASQAIVHKVNDRFAPITRRFRLVAATVERFQFARV